MSAGISKKFLPGHQRLRCPFLLYRETSRFCDPPQAESFASETLSCMAGSYVITKERKSEKMTKIILIGCNGRMGQMITNIVADDEGAQIVAGIDIVDNRDNGYPVYTELLACREEADAIIDFSSAQEIEKRVDYAVERKIALVECSTGLTDEQTKYLLAAGDKIPVLRSANMSLGVNLLMKLVQEAAKKLAAEGFDIEIVEKHHNQKLDAPSGTALALADSINEAMDNQYEYVYDRSQVRKKRDKKELGISAVRGGTIVGEHDVIFAGTDEVVTFSHTAYSRGVFAKGSVVAAKFLRGKKPGHYDMADVLL